MADEDFKKFCERFKSIQKEWLHRFYNYIKVMMTKEDSQTLDAEIILNKILLYLDVDSQTNVSTVALSTLNDALELSPCQFSLKGSKGKQLKCERSLVICKLVPMDSSPGNLCLADVYGNHIPCEVLEKYCENCLVCLNQWSILSSFSIFKEATDCKQYVEINGPLLMLQDSPQYHQLKVLNTKDAKLLLENKEKVKTELVNFCGKVQVVSEVFRVKNDSLFCVRLESNLNILIKNVKYVHWQKFLIPQKEFVFTNMKPTTLQKGAGESIKVYVPWKNSGMDFCKEESMIFTSLDEWLSANGIPDSVKTDLSARWGTSSTDTENQFSYQGIITDTEFACFGVYELDNSVRLYLSYVPVVYTALRLGTQIMIYNAHLKKTKKIPKIRIVCCMSSCIKVVEFAEVSSPTVKTTCPPFIQLLWKHQHSLNFLTFVVDTILKFKKKFSSYSVEKLEAILLVLQGIDCKLFPRRNHLHEVYNNNHVSCFKPDAEEFIIETPELCEIDISEADNKMNDMAAARHDGSKDWNQTLYWSYMIDQEKSGSILIGEIHISSKTAQVQLRDQTEFIDCVVIETEHDLDQYHICSENCCLCHQTLSSKFTCPFLHPDHSGCLVAITKFYIVKERFLVGNFTELQNIDSINEKSGKVLWRKYLMFSMSDVILIWKSKHSCNGKQQIDSYTTRSFQIGGLFVNHKESLRYTEWTKQNCGLSFIVHVCKFPHFKNVDITEQTSVNRADDSSIQNSNTAYSELKKKYTGMSQGKQTCSKCQLFLLEKSNIKYYPLIKSGYCYRFSHLDIVTALNQKLPWQIKQSAKRAGDYVLNVLPETATVQREFHAQKEEPTDKIVNIQNDGPCDDYINIIGRIVRRVHLEPDNVGMVLKRLKVDSSSFAKVHHVATLDNWQVQLQVRCLKSDSEISVYLKLDNIVYPLGLIPGSVIYLEHVERRVSRKGVIYCQYSVVSSLTVLHHYRGSADVVSSSFRFTNSEENCIQKIDKSETLQTAYLMDLWLDSALKEFSCVCFIQKVLKISMKCVCQMCGSLVMEGCSNTSCHSDEYKFVARMSVIIDDGTSVAMVSCLDTEVQAVLLLSNEEWEALKLSVKSHGEIFLQQTFPNLGTILEKFIFILCDNTQIKRNVNMAVRYKPVSSKTDQSSHPADLLNSMSLEDFTAKRIDTGLSTVNTRCIPFLQLTCIRVTEIDNRKQIMSYISDL